MSEIIDRVMMRATNLERYSSGQIKTIAPKINSLANAINVLIATSENPNKNIVEINNLIDSTFQDIESFALNEYSQIVLDEIRHERQLYEDLQQEGQEGWQVILAALILGETFKQSLSRIRLSVKRKITIIIKSGLADNLPISVIARQVRGTVSRQYKDGIYGSILNNISALVRTAITTYTNRAKIWLWDKSGVTKYVWISVLDSRTTAICRARSNKVYKIGEGPVPPAHYRCRSTILKYDKGVELPQSYGEWLSTQPVNVIEDILGKGKAKIFLGGKLNLDKFVTPTGRELTLKELLDRTSQ